MAKFSRWFDKVTMNIKLMIPMELKLKGRGGGLVFWKTLLKALEPGTAESAIDKIFDDL